MGDAVTSIGHFNVLFIVLLMFDSNCNGQPCMQTKTLYCSYKEISVLMILEVASDNLIFCVEIEKKKFAHMQPIVT